MNNMRFHAIALSCIIGAVILIFAATGKLSPKPPAKGSAPAAAAPEIPGDKLVTIWEASWGLNCNETIEREKRYRPAGSRMPAPVAKNNIKEGLAKLCNEKEVCEFVADDTLLGNPIGDIRCKPELDVVYRCFAIDRPWTLHARFKEKVTINCKGR